MFPLSAVGSVFSQDNPFRLILLVATNVPVAFVNHRLDGKRHAWHEKHSRAFLAVVLHIGVFVESKPDAVTT